jgi:hypothetical protein
MEIFSQAPGAVNFALAEAIGEKMWAGFSAPELA